MAVVRDILRRVGRMEKIIIYGVGSTGRRIFHELKKTNASTGEVIAFTDSNPNWWGKDLFGIRIISPDEIVRLDYSSVIVGTMMYESVVLKLENELHIPKEQVDTSYVATSTAIINRNKFLSSFARIVYANNIQGSVAEGGVFMGDFAKQINACFPDRRLYLFDTFDGFDMRDVEDEYAKGYSGYEAGHLLSSEETVKSVLPHPGKAIIRKGYFPETTLGVDDSFIFVNLDFDLYNPTLAGLEFFWGKMVCGGVILVHDYFNVAYKGIEAAINEFCETKKTACIPIADEISVAFVKY